jgi:PhzF family phenazine biosynthesis protein
VVRSLGPPGGPGGAAGQLDRVVLQMAAGLVEVRAVGDRWTLRAARAPAVREPAATPDELAAMLGLPAGAVTRPLWVDTGIEQLVLPVRGVAEVRAARPDPALLARHGRATPGGEAMAYLWAEAAPGRVEARLFFMAGGGVVEDPATGSAAANLGGWLLTTGAPRPVTLEIDQGRAVRRPSRLELTVEADGGLLVSGQVVELGRGSLVL